MNARRVIAVIGLLGTVGLCVWGWSNWELGLGSNPQPERTDAKPHVVFYLVDTLRGDRLSINEYDRDTSPFLKWLSERSVVFDTCLTQAPWTKPSMASMLTSKYPSTTGVYQMLHRLPNEQVTWPEHLSANGYKTAGFSANIVMGGMLSNYNQGFDHFVESTFINRGDPIRFASGSAKKLNRRIFSWLDRQKDLFEEPTLLYVHSVDPHEEYEPEAEFLEEFADPDRHPQFQKEWQKLLASRPQIPGLYVTQDNFDRTQIDADSFIQHASNLYDADILANDDQIEVLWERLKEKELGDNVVFILTSDHGEEFFEHGGTSHGYSLYEEMIRVPLMIYAPGILPQGKRIEEPVRNLDIFPTLCDLLGLEIPEDLEGRSLVPLIRGEEENPNIDIYSEHREDPGARMMGMGSGVMVSVRQGPWKLILNQTSNQLIERPRYELYNLKQDPGEQDNVASDYPDLLDELEAKVNTFVGDRRSQDELKEWMNNDEDIRAQLEALGYLVGDEGEEPPDLWESVIAQDNDQVRLALDGGADPNTMSPALFLTPLSMAALRGDLELTKILVEAGAKVDARNRDQATPLMGAAFLGRVDVLSFLLEQGADPSATNNGGASAVQATQAPWDFTVNAAGSLNMTLDRQEVESGRAKCQTLLLQKLKDKGA